MCSRHSHQLPPRFCGRQWRVMRATKGERFLFLSCLWRLGFRFEFNVWWRRSMERGHMARADWGYWWHDPWVSRYFSVSLDFWFQKLFFFLHSDFSFFSCSECLSLLLVSAIIPILLRRRISLASTFPLFKVCYFFDFSQIFSSWPPYKFLIFPLSFTFVVFVFDVWAFRIGYPFSWLVLLRFG